MINLKKKTKFIFLENFLKQKHLVEKSSNNLKKSQKINLPLTTTSTAVNNKKKPRKIKLKAFNFISSFSLIGKYFLVYNGLKSLNLRFRYPFTFNSIKSFIKSRPNPKLIGLKFKLKKMKTQKRGSSGSNKK